MTIVKIACGNGIYKNVDIDMSLVMKDVYDKGNKTSIKLVTKRIHDGRFDRAFEMAYAGLAGNKMSTFEFALKYGKQV